MVISIDLMLIKHLRNLLNVILTISVVCRQDRKSVTLIHIATSPFVKYECLYYVHEENKNKCSGSQSLEGGIPLVVLVDVLDFLGVEFLFCNAEGTLGMASTVLVAWLLGAACCKSGDSCGICGSLVVS